MIDGHCHLDRRIRNCALAMERLQVEASRKGIRKIALINIPELNYPSREVLGLAAKYEGFFRVVAGINPMRADAAGEIGELRSLGVVGFKLHPRFHGYRIDRVPAELLASLAASKCRVWVDTFCDGRCLALGNTPEAFARFAASAPPGMPIALCHAGGHRVLDALMIAKTFRDVFLDLSFTLLYFRGCSVMSDVGFAIKSLKAERVFWGSDHPDRPYSQTLDMSCEVLEGFGLTSEERLAIGEGNALRFLGETP
jgi:predicted TIM-barrel fold metal-dependent hydrolase